MTIRQAHIGKVWDSFWPAPQEIEAYFSSYGEEEWGEGGASGASFVLYGAEGTVDKAPFKGRIDIRLDLVDCPNVGVHVHYSRIGDGPRQDYFCLWDEKLLGENFSSRHDSPYSKALVVPFSVAFQVVKSFLENDGKLPDCVEWTRDDELPEAALPVLDV